MMTIEIFEEQEIAIVVNSLARTLHCLKEDYENGLFTSDRDEDRKKLKRLIKALERVLDWYEVTP